MSSAGYRPTGCHAASGALIFYGLSGANRRFQFHKRHQRFIRTCDETLSSSRCASTIQSVRPSESMAETQPKLHPALLSLSA
jgi:hypothetical protein